jgi:hypothetical protein
MPRPCPIFLLQPPSHSGAESHGPSEPKKFVRLGHSVCLTWRPVPAAAVAEGATTGRPAATLKGSLWQEKDGQLLAQFTIPSVQVSAQFQVPSLPFSSSTQIQVPSHPASSATSSSQLPDWDVSPLFSHHAIFQGPSPISLSTNPLPSKLTWVIAAPKRSLSFVVVAVQLDDLNVGDLGSLQTGASDNNFKVLVNRRLHWPLSNDPSRPSWVESVATMKRFVSHSYRSPT